MPDRYRVADLRALATRSLTAAGLAPAPAETVADTLIEGDLMGHTTHGLALLAPYVSQFETGGWAIDGVPDVLSATDVAQAWDGRHLAGPWLMAQAIGWARTAARDHGVACVTIARSAHIACLAAYLRPVAEAGQMIVLTCSDPAAASVAPYGGTRRLFTPNPLAAGWPSPGGPVMIDVSMSVTTNGMTNRLRAEGARFPHPWLLDAQGRPTDDPEAFFADGTLLPLGGVEAGHKGYALALLVEALTSGLAGHGRATAPAGWGASVTVLILDPARFAGAAAFAEESAWIAGRVAANPPADPARPPRLPGARALRLRLEQLAHGVQLHPAIPPALSELAAAVGLPMPRPI